MNDLVTQAKNTLTALINDDNALHAGVATIYVTTLADSGPGSLREALDIETSAPVRIRSKVSGTVRLQSRIYSRRSNMLLDIPELELSGGCIDQQPSINLEFTNLRIISSPDDGLFLRPGVSNFYIHNISVRDCQDEEIAIAGHDGIVEYCLIYDPLPPTGGGMWTVSAIEGQINAENVTFRRNLGINIFKRLGNANSGINIQNYENHWINCINAPFTVAGCVLYVYHNTYEEGLDSNAGDWSLLKSNGGTLHYGKNYKCLLDGTIHDMDLKIDPSTSYTLPSSYIPIPEQSQDYDWQAVKNDLVANAGASIRDATDNATLMAALARTSRTPVPPSQYTG